MKTTTFALAVAAGAALLGAAAGHALRPAPKILGVAPPPGPAAPGPGPVAGPTLGQVAQGTIPTGPGVPPALAGVPWIGAGGNLAPWRGLDPTSPGGNTSRVYTNPACQSLPGPQVFPNLPASSTVWFLPPVQPGDPVYFTVQVVAP